MSTNTQRFTALDVFRGMTICLMIIVNTPGNGDTTYAPLHHAAWHGFTPTDLVFPSFLFAVGNALSFVMNKWQTMSQAQVLGKIFKRTVIIFLLGYLMYWFPFVKWNEAGQLTGAPFATTRIFGVLQRIALCYCIGALLIHYLKPRMALIVSIGFLVLYWVALLVFANGADSFSMQGNAGFVLDKWLVGEAHLYHGEGVAFDPEGFLSTFPAVGNVVAGFWVGRHLQQKGNSWQALAQLLIVGSLLLFVAWCWNMSFPINKKLWTSSFVLHTVGLDCIILAIIIYIIDFLHRTSWTYFFEVMGRNPLFIYLVSELGAILLYFFKADANTSLFQAIYNGVFVHAGAYFGSLLFALSFMMCCWLLGYWLDKQKIYIKV